MKGISFDELYELVSHYHDAEFTYKGVTYVLQPEEDDGKMYLVIWDCSDNSKCLCRYENINDGGISKDVIEAILNDKCFDGKSFMDIEKEIEVTVIF